MKLKKGDICKVKGGTSAVCWDDKIEVHLLTNMLQVIMWAKKEMHLNLCALKFTKETWGLLIQAI
jgi:hypothetical protein